jgi:hypothetical protein
MTSGSRSSSPGKGLPSACLVRPYLRILGAWWTQLLISHCYYVDGVLTESPSSPTLSSISLVLSSTNLWRPFGTILVEELILAI